MLRLVGALCVVLGASGAGLSMALGAQRALRQTRQLGAALEQMKNEIAYRRTPLPELMRLLEVSYPGPLGALFGEIAAQLALRQEASVYAIVRKALSGAPLVGAQVRQVLLELSPGLGQYGVQGQLYALELAAGRARELTAALEAGQKGRLRSYSTLGVCAGLAVAILVF